MKNGLLILASLAGLAGMSWAILLLTPHSQYGALAPHRDAVDQSVYPADNSGLAVQGMRVYQDLGCVQCHTQQVRFVGGDLERRWGTRPSFARDYIRDESVFIGSNRVGPDLRNVGGREYASAEYFHQMLYAPASQRAHKPAFKFLYEVREVLSGQESPKAVSLPSSHAPGEGYEVVPTHRAEALVAYLQSLNDTYQFLLETQRNAPAEKKEGGH